MRKSRTERSRIREGVVCGGRKEREKGRQPAAHIRAACSGKDVTGKLAK
jgi:hypothetical protein